MQGLHKEIYDLQNRIKENELKLSLKFTELGKIIIKGDPDKLVNTVLIETFNEIHKLNKVEPQKKKDMQSIMKIEENLLNIRARIKEKKKEMSEQEKETRQHYRNIGESAYHVYKENRDVNNPFKMIFFDLISIDEKLTRNDQGRKDFKEINQMDRKDNFLKQFVNVAKSIFYEKKQDILVSRQNALYAQVGRKVMESEFLKVNEDQDLNELVAPLNTLLSGIEQIKQELSRLAENEKDILQNLHELGVRGNSAKRIKEIENEIAETQKIINNKYQELGRLYHSHSKEVKIQFPEIAEIINIIKLSFSENEAYRETIKKLNARIEIQGIQEKIQKNNKSIENIKMKMEKEKDDILTLTKTNSGYETEVNRLIKENKLED